jgi:leader peptidase (prepilin peptidase) / N-methyltransferase
VQHLLDVYFFALGAMIGSYLNVVVYRLPLGISTVTPRSRCPRCLSPIRPWHNLPIFGFLLLGGRCFDCRGRIGWRYPAIEALVGLIFWRLSHQYGPTLNLPIHMVFAALLVVLALIDLDHHGLPHLLLWPALLLVLAFRPGIEGSSAWLGALLGAALFFTVAQAWRWLRKDEGFGWGDIGLAALLGGFFGPDELWSIIGLAALVALLVHVTWPRLRRQPVPFGFYLGMAALALMLTEGSV